MVSGCDAVRTSVVGRVDEEVALPVEDHEVPQVETLGTPGCKITLWLL